MPDTVGLLVLASVGAGDVASTAAIGSLTWGAIVGNVPLVAGARPVRLSLPAKSRDAL
jgi:hypothetical protein